MGNKSDDPNTFYEVKYRAPQGNLFDLAANGWNGAVKDCQIYITSDLEKFGDPVAKPVFKKSRQTQRTKFAKTTGRYVKLVITSEVNGGPWASISELGFVGK